MLCTACNQPLKPVVAFDVDGTTGDYHGHLIDFGLRWKGWDGIGLWKPNVETYSGEVDLATYLEVDKATYRQIKLAYRQGGMKRTMPVFPHAAEVVNSLHAMGIEVWITTTRPYMRLDNVDPDTRHWLDFNGFTYDGLIYDENKYERLIEIVGAERICGVVEDLPDQFDKAWELGLRPIQHWTKYNRAVRRNPGHHLLEVVGDMLVGQVKEWSELHANH